MKVARAESDIGSRHFWGPHIREDDVLLRLWAPDEDRVRLRLAGQEFAMTAADDGWFEHACPRSFIGSQYQFVLSDGLAVPDPASRGQAGPVNGPSCLAAPDAYRWTQVDWRGRPWAEAVLYELHIGTFTPEGTFRAAMEKLPHLAELGITALEVMPVAHFSGERGWGYDGVLHYAPHRAYGSPEDMKAFIDAAHELGIMVVLDVVYNHFGPEGNYLAHYAKAFFRDDKQTPWGAAIDFSQAAVRDYFIGNALYWIDEFRLDGLRFDAVEQIFDTSPKHLLADIAETVRHLFPDRHVHLVIEDQRNDVGLLQRDGDGRPKAYTAEWNDDFHHVAHVIATGETVGHYKDFSTELMGKLGKSLCEGFIFPNRSAQGAAELTKTESGMPLPPACFIDFLQNHDQVGNRAFGERLLSLADESLVKALTAIMLLSPQIPFLFMGEEYGETQPFFFFCDYTGELGDIVRNGRIKEAEGFGGLKQGKSVADLPDPNAQGTFEASKLRWEAKEADRGREWTGFIRKLLDIRRKFVVPMLAEGGDMKAAITAAADEVIAVSWTSGGRKLCLAANLAREPRVAPTLTGSRVYRLAGELDTPSTGTVLPAHSVILVVDTETSSGR
jgi:malto-oligosyltrehalose trehalohydrolase